MTKLHFKPKFVFFYKYKWKQLMEYIKLLSMSEEAGGISYYKYT